MTSADIVVFNPRYQKLQEWVDKSKAIKHPYDALLPVNKEELLLVGEHNRDNARAAATVARLFGLDETVIAEGLKTFASLPHRLQYIGTYRDITFYDDAISTTPESTIAALSALNAVGTLMVGGENRGYNFSELAQRIVRKNIPNIILFPDSGEQIAEALQKNGFTGMLHQTNDMKQAVQFAYEHTPQHTICLLSTASPSYSVWKNFEQKGDLFQQYVKELSASQQELPCFS